jgi:hypothetical protein
MSNSLFDTMNHLAKSLNKNLLYYKFLVQANFGFKSKKLNQIFAKSVIGRYIDSTLPRSNTPQLLPLSSEEADDNNLIMLSNDQIYVSFSKQSQD